MRVILSPYLSSYIEKQKDILLEIDYDDRIFDDEKEFPAIYKNGISRARIEKTVPKDEGRIPFFSNELVDQFLRTFHLFVLQYTMKRRARD